MKNIDRIYVGISLGVGFIGVALALIPIFGLVDIFDGGGAMIMIGILLAITGPVVSLLFWHRARVFDEIMNNDNRLLHWRFDESLWQRFVRDEKDFRADRRHGIQITILIFSVLFGVIFWIADPEAGWVVLLTMLGLNVVIALVAMLSGRAVNKWENAKQVEFLMVKDGLIINGQLHVWSGWGARLEGAGTSGKKIELLEIVYSVPARYGRQSYTVRIPIPSGKQQEAEIAAMAILKNNHQ